MNFGNSRRKTFVKIFAGPIWEGRLLEFVDVFTMRRGQFESAMAIRTTIGVDMALLKLDTVDERNVELARRCVSPPHVPNVQMPKPYIRMDVMIELFQEFVNPQQKILAAKVEEMGGYDVLENEQMMNELARVESTLNTGLHPESRPGGGRPLDLRELRKEIDRDPEEVIQMNSEFFDRKFAIQKREIEEDIDRAVNRVGERVISAFTAGPHDRIVDLVWRDVFGLHIARIESHPYPLGHLQYLEVHGE